MAFAALFDPLYCPEEHLDLYQEEEPAGAGEEADDWSGRLRPAVLDSELPELFEALRGKEVPPIVVGAGTEAEECGGYGGAAGREAAVGWASRAAARLGFSALTAALATAYLDGCFLGRRSEFRLVGGGQPWMTRLAAVACVSLAGKVEETRVPLLDDLQVLSADPVDDGCVFDAPTVGRMELFVLSALGWRMHPVTPFSYLEPLLADAAARLRHCEGVLLPVMPDWRWSCHRPSAWAAAALLATASCGGGDDDDDSELLALINAPEDEVTECAKIISEVTGMCFLAGDEVGTGTTNKDNNNNNKRKYSAPASPSSVIGALSGFSCASSSNSLDSRAAAPAVSVLWCPETVERPPKRAVPDEESRDAWPPSTCAA